MILHITELHVRIIKLCFLATRSGKAKSWHAVRHTYITLSVEHEIPIKIVVDNTGDKPATILEYYTKLSVPFIRKSIEERKLFRV